MQEIVLRPAGVARALVIVAIVLVVASSAGQFAHHLLGIPSGHPLVALFNLNREGNVPTFFSVFLLFSAAQLLAVIAILERRVRSAAHATWLVLSAGFACMAIDEGWHFHERVGGALRAALGLERVPLFHFAWVVPGLCAIAAVAIVSIPLLRSFPRDLRLRFLGAAALYLGGAVGMEMLGGPLAESRGLDDALYAVVTTLEETLEMVGAVAFLHALLLWLARRQVEVRVRPD
jgi:uncharacterized membrane protein YhaH (DUF805 family)